MLRWGDIGIVGLEALVREKFDIQAIFSHLDASKERSGCPRTGVLPFVNVPPPYQGSIKPVSVPS